MDNYKISNIVSKQKQFFRTNKTKDIKFRLENLRKLKKLILQNEEKISDAIYADLKKSRFESYMSEIAIIIDEINYHIKKLKKWSKPKKVHSPYWLFPASSFIYQEPYGAVLIIAPWNYPVNLLIMPLIGAISAGNCVILKPSDYSSHTSALIENLFKDNFKSDYISVFQGGRDTNKDLLNEKFDYIFFTGSSELGRIVMTQAAKNLTPVTLELGGKCPCIIDKDADIDIAAKRTAWGKLLNAGQTCVAPDYLFVHEDIKEDFINKLRFYFIKFYGNDIKNNKEYPRIISEKHFLRLKNLMKKADVIIGGEIDQKEKYISPTVIDNVKPEDPVMENEIFGPVLPIMNFTSLDTVISFINENPKPLALYYFSQSRYNHSQVLSSTSSGAVCINDTVMHITNNKLPFGGVGNSGMGCYHGKYSFETFSNTKSVIKNSKYFDTNFRYPPYKSKLKMLKYFKMFRS